jgi:hypothetical protein
VTKPFTARQKYRILVTYNAQAFVEGRLIPVAHYVYGTMSETRRFAMLQRALNCAVKCACGCDAWAPLREIEFDHVKNWASGGRSTLCNGRPLRRTPCHADKTAAEAAVTGKCVRVRRKLATHQARPTLSATDGISENDSRGRARTSRRPWPKRSFTDPRWRKTFAGTVERRT